MSEQACRSIGAIIGLALGMTLMFSMGMYNLIPAFVFGAGGTVIGSIAGEKYYARNRPR